MSLPPWPDWTADQWRDAVALLPATKFDASKHPRHGKGSEAGGEFKDTAFDVPLFEGVDAKANVPQQVEKHLAKWEELTGKRPTPEALQAAEAELRALPLVHGTTVAGAVGAAKQGLLSHADMATQTKDLTEDIEDLKGSIENIVGEDADWGNIPFWTEDDISGLDLERSDAEALLEYVRQLQDIEKVIMGTTNKADEKLGLDQFVFMTHGAKHQDYGNVAVLIDNEVIEKGFATERDIVTVPGGVLGDDNDAYLPARVENYRDMIVKGEDYYPVAAAHAGSAEFLEHRSRDQLFEVKASSVPAKAVKGFMIEGDYDAAVRLADKLDQQSRGRRLKNILYVDDNYGPEKRKFVQDQLKALQATGMFDEDMLEAFKERHEGVYLL